VASVAIDERVADDLARAVRGSRSGDVEVVDVETEWLFNRDMDEYIQVVLVLSEPKAGTDTWPVDDTYQLRTKARNEAAKLGLGVSQIAISLRTSGDSQTADDEGDTPARPGRHTEDEGPASSA